MRDILRWCLLVACLAAAGAAQGSAQRDPALRAVIAAAIQAKPCFDDQFDEAVWMTLMQPRVERRLRQRPHDLRLGDDLAAAARQIVTAVHCEASKHSSLRDRPHLVLAVIDVESAFNPFAVSHAGAVGLMQVMPFWPSQLGLERPDLIDVELNIRMGTSILAYYLDKESGDYRRGLARYNGSLGRRQYPDRVLNRLERYWGR
ncbi:MAG: lytic transglycosylase domain-containing protein [Steroidobacteraceae bacterium]